MSVYNNIVSSLKNTGKFYLFFFSVVFLLQACGGEEDQSTKAPEVIVISGSAVKGPLANAKVTIYEIDLTQPNYRGAAITEGSTNVTSHISGLSLPLESIGPYLLEITSTPDTTDITTGKPPIIKTLRTIISSEMLINGDSIYASPQTTMATDIAFAKSDPTRTNPLSINAAATSVISVFGFGMSTNINLFSTPPVITSKTKTAVQHREAAEYRSAIEALSALVFKLGNEIAPTKVTAEQMLKELTADLTDDNMVNGIINGAQSSIINVAVVTAINSLNPATLPIPESLDESTGTPYLVEDVEKILVAEKETTINGDGTIDTSELEDGTISFTPIPAKTENDTDGDSIMDSMDNCPNKANTDQADSNNNGVGDVCDGAPVVNNDTGSVNEGATLTATKSILTNDTDPEGDSLTAIIVTPPATTSAFTLKADGTYIYTHDGSETTSDSFTYRANDGTSDSANTATVTITINPVNDLPVAVDDSITTVQGGTETKLSGTALSPPPNTVLYNDTDADGDTLTALLVTPPANHNGTFLLGSDGTFSYTHDGGASLADSFTYRVNDGTGDSIAVATVTITIASNTAPVANNNSITVDEGATVSVLVGGQNSVLYNDTDVEGSPLSAILVTTQVPANSSSFNLNVDGTFSYTHDGSETTSDSFAYFANDGLNNSKIAATVTITVIPINDAPTAVADTAAITEDSLANPVTGTLLSNDTDPDNVLADFSMSTVNTVTVSATTPLVTQLTYGKLTVKSDGTYDYLLDNTNAAVNVLSTGQILTDTANYTMSDGVDTSAATTLTITITGVTDVVVPSVDLSGVWQVSSTITLQNPANCETGTKPPIDLTSTRFVTITQTGSALDVKSHLGANFTGIVTADAFTLNANVVRRVADFSTPGIDSGALVNWTETVSVTGTGVSQTSLTGSSNTTRIIPGIGNCYYEENYSASFIYKHTGTEQYSGVYGEEIWNEASSNSVTKPIQTSVKTQSSSTVEFVINNTSINIYLPELNNLAVNSNKTVVFTNATYDPNNGFFTAIANFDFKIDNNADTVVDSNIIGSRTLSGIFLRSPAGLGSNGRPIAAMSLIGYHRVYPGDKALGVTADEVIISGEESYLRRVTTAGRTRTALYENADLTTSSKIKVGVVNPPLKKVSTTSKLYIEVINPTAVAPASKLLCRAPYAKDGIINGQYHENSNHPNPNFEALNFRIGTNYATVNCFPLPLVNNGDIVKIQVRDTGSDGLRDGDPGASVTDSITVINANYPVEVYTPAFTQLTPAASINVNGATSSSTLTGAVVPLLGYFNFTKPISVQWNANSELLVNGEYQLRHENSQETKIFRYRSNSTTPLFNIPNHALHDGDTLQVVGVNRTAGTGKVAQAMSRKIVLQSGINGEFDIDLGAGILVAYRKFRISLNQSGGVVQCSVIAAGLNLVANPAVSCKANVHTVSVTTDIVELAMTDVPGNLTGVAGSQFLLLLKFKTNGPISSNQAVITSAPGVTNIPIDVSARATLFNP